MRAFLFSGSVLFDDTDGKRFSWFRRYDASVWSAEVHIRYNVVPAENAEEPDTGVYLVIGAAVFWYQLRDWVFWRNLHDTRALVQLDAKTAFDDEFDKLH